MPSHTHTQLFYGYLDFFWDNLGKPEPEETCTHSHLSWSSIIPYLLPPSIMIHGILSVQFTSLTVFFHNHNLSPSFLWSTSWPGTLNLIPILFFIKSLSSFHSNAHVITTCFAVVPRLCHLIIVSLSTHGLKTRPRQRYPLKTKTWTTIGTPDVRVLRYLGLCVKTKNQVLRTASLQLSHQGSLYQ